MTKKNATKQQVERLAKSMNCTIYDSDFAIEAHAPDLHDFGAGTHYYTAPYRRGEKSDAWQGIFEDLTEVKKHNLVSKCEESGCEWCADTRDGISVAQMLDEGQVTL